MVFVIAGVTVATIDGHGTWNLKGQVRQKPYIGDDRQKQTDLIDWLTLSGDTGIAIGVNYPESAYPDDYGTWTGMILTADGDLLTYRVTENGEALMGASAAARGNYIEGTLTPSTRTIVSLNLYNTFGEVIFRSVNGDFGADVLVGEIKEGCRL
jgi:hypothetical protein